MNVIFISNLYPNLAEPMRGMFNASQWPRLDFSKLASLCSPRLCGKSLHPSVVA
jgi:hypothetical protein